MATRVSSNVEFYMNTIERVMQYKGVQKQINDDYWESSIAPLLYPFWDNPKDRLELFVYNKDDSFVVTRSKYKRDWKTNTSTWVSYSFDPTAAEPASVSNFKNQLVEKFIEFKDLSDKTYEDFITQEYSRTNSLTWKKIQLVRKFLLQDSDFIFNQDYEISDERKALWKQYRTYIRDIPEIQKGTETPFDVVFPITPDEYLKRKELYIEPLVAEMVGDQGINDDYLTSSYHFWKLSAPNLAMFAQRFSFYIAARAITSDLEPNYRIMVSNFITKFTANPEVQASRINSENSSLATDSFIDDLLNKIELGEL